MALTGSEDVFATTDLDIILFRIISASSADRECVLGKIAIVDV